MDVKATPTHGYKTIKPKPYLKINYGVADAAYDMAAALEKSLRDAGRTPHQLPEKLYSKMVAAKLRGDRIVSGDPACGSLKRRLKGCRGSVYTDDFGTYWKCHKCGGVLR